MIVRFPTAPGKTLSVAVSAVLLLFANLSVVSGRADDGPSNPSADEIKVAGASRPKQELFRGQVLRLPDALDGLDTRTAEAMAAHVVLKTSDGELIPILADWRGRAFYQDERLRDRDVELVGFRRPGLPYLQVLMIFTFNEAGERQYTDYWCDVCSIPMYEIKPCECCQGDIRLRCQVKDLPEYLRLSEAPQQQEP